MMRILVSHLVATLVGINFCTAFVPSSHSALSKWVQQQQHTWVFRNHGSRQVPFSSSPSYRLATTLPKENEEKYVRDSPSMGTQQSSVATESFFNLDQMMSFNTGIPYNEITIGVLKESYPGENRVAQTPDSIRNLVKAGFSVIVQTGGTF